MVEKKLPSLFIGIDSRDEALKTIKATSTGFFVLAAIQGGLGVFLMPSMLHDALVFAVLAALLRWLKSRIVACILMLMASIITITTVLSFLGIAKLGGRNVWLAAIMFLAAVKAVEATFKLHGRFKEVPPSFEYKAEPEDREVSSKSPLSDELLS